MYYYENKQLLIVKLYTLWEKIMIYNIWQFHLNRNRSKNKLFILNIGEVRIG